MKNLLIAEDDLNFRETLAVEFEERDYRVFKVSSLKEYRSLSAVQFEYAVVDLKLGADCGIAVVEDLLTANSACKVIMLTGYGSIATAVKAMRLGALNYLTKPASFQQIERCLVSDAVSESKSSDAEFVQPSLARQEREYIESVLTQCSGNISQTAKILGLHRQSLQRKLRKFTPFF